MRAQKSDRKIEKKRLEKHHGTIWIILFFFSSSLGFLFADIVRTIRGNLSGSSTSKGSARLVEHWSGGKCF